MPKTGVLLTAFGGPDCMAEVGPFMSRLMGREPSPEVLERARRKYLTIGGGSPLPATAARIAAALREKLSSDAAPVAVVAGMCYAPPFIGDAVRALASDGVERVVMVSLSPFESKVAHGAYRRDVEEALAGLPGLEIVEAPMLHEAPEYAQYLIDACKETIGELKGHHPLLTVFSAHSLPESDLVDDDPYARELRALAESIAAAADLGPAGVVEDDPHLPGIESFGHIREGVSWVFAYQSKGARPGAWLGPDIADVVRAAAEGGFRSVASCPIGFATDHMETLYDLDVVVADEVLSADLEFARSRVPNDDPMLVDALARLVKPLL